MQVKNLLYEDTDGISKIHKELKEKSQCWAFITYIFSSEASFPKLLHHFPFWDFPNL